MLCGVRTMQHLCVLADGDGYQREGCARLLEAKLSLLHP